MSENVRGVDGAHKSGAVQEIVEIAKTVVYALLIALVLRVLFFQPFTIPSASMEPNLLEGDYIIVSKWSYGYSRHSIPFSPPLPEGRIFESPPNRGDVVVFKLPSDGRTDYIKRLIGLPGDRIQVRGGQIFINGQPVPREELPPATVETPYGAAIEVQRFLETLPNGRSYVTYDMGPDGDVDNTPVYLVPDGHYFFMGDNRDNSLDSRVPAGQGVGFVPAENLVGRAQIILLSWHRGAHVLKPWTWFLDARPSRFFNVLQ